MGGGFLPVFWDTPTAGGPSHRTGARAWARAKARAALQTRSHKTDLAPALSALSNGREGGTPVMPCALSSRYSMYMRTVITLHGICCTSQIRCNARMGQLRVAASIIAHARSSTAGLPGGARALEAVQTHLLLRRRRSDQLEEQLHRAAPRPSSSSKRSCDRGGPSKDTCLGGSRHALAAHNLRQRCYRRLPLSPLRSAT